MATLTDQLDQLLQLAQTWTTEERDALAAISPDLIHLLDDFDTLQEHEAQEPAALEEMAERLAMERQRYRALFDFAPDAYLTTDTNSIIIDANVAAGELFRIPSTRLIGKPLSVYLNSEGRHQLYSTLKEIQPGTIIRDWETRLTPRHTDPVDISISITLLIEVDHQGEPTRQLRWLLRDVTAYKLMQEAERDRFFSSTFDLAAVGMAHISDEGRFLHVNARLAAMLGYTVEELQHLTFYELTHPDDLGISRHHQRQLMSGRATQYAIEKRFIHRDGRVIWADVSASSVHSTTGKFLYSIKVVEDITARKWAEAREREQRRLAEALRDSAIAIAGTFDLEQVMEQVLVSVNRIVPHESAILALVDNGVVRNVYTRGFTGTSQIQRLIEHSFSPDASPHMVALLASRRPVVIANWRDEVQQRGLSPDMDLLSDMVSALMVPIISGDTITAVVSLLSRQAGAFTPEHVNVLSAFAAQIAVALKSIQAVEQSRHLAVLEDRQRLARDLHDAVTQTLFSANVLVESLPRLWTNVPPRVGSQLDQIQILTRGALAEMRILLLELRPENLAHIDLSTSLHQLVDAVRGRKRLHIELDIGENSMEGLPTDVQVALYRIAQEALNNVVKHSRATRVVVQLVGNPIEVQLLIRDNGIGFDAKRITSGFGLQSMSERAREMEAMLHATSAPGDGTTITVIWKRPT